jgi:hypothetical protein
MLPENNESQHARLRQETVHTYKYIPCISAIRAKKIITTRFIIQIRRLYIEWAIH